MTKGDAYVVTGQGTAGSSLNQPAPVAQLNCPDSVPVDSHGNIVIADNGNGEIEVVPDTYIYVVAGNGTSGYEGDGGPTTSAELSGPGGVRDEEHSHQ